MQTQLGTPRGVLGGTQVPSTQLTPVPAHLGGVKPTRTDASQTQRYQREDLNRAPFTAAIKFLEKLLVSSLFIRKKGMKKPQEITALFVFHRHITSMQYPSETALKHHGAEIP